MPVEKTGIIHEMVLNIYEVTWHFMDINPVSHNDVRGFNQMPRQFANQTKFLDSARIYVRFINVAILIFFLSML